MNSDAGTPPLTSAQRQELMRRAHTLPPRVQVGRSGVTDGIVAQVRQVFEKTDLVKVRVQVEDTADADAAADALASRVPCHLVRRVGKTVIIARFEQEEPE